MRREVGGAGARGACRVALLTRAVPRGMPCFLASLHTAVRLLPQPAHTWRFMLGLRPQILRSGSRPKPLAFFPPAPQAAPVRRHLQLPRPGHAVQAAADVRLPLRGGHARPAVWACAGGPQVRACPVPRETWRSWWLPAHPGPARHECMQHLKRHSQGVPVPEEAQISAALLNAWEARCQARGCSAPARLSTLPPPLLPSHPSSLPWRPAGSATAMLPWRRRRGWPATSGHDRQRAGAPC